MSNLLSELRQRLLIDKADLDREISEQPTLYFEVADAATEAAAERDACKEELETVDAELDHQVRKDLNKKVQDKKIEKITEAMVKHAIQINEDHQAAFDTYMAAKLKSDRYAALKESFHQRSYMLRELAGLYVSKYYENSSVQGTSSSDSAKYRTVRAELAAARVKRERERRNE